MPPYKSEAVQTIAVQMRMRWDQVIAALFYPPVLAAGQGLGALSVLEGRPHARTPACQLGLSSQSCHTSGTRQVLHASQVTWLVRRVWLHHLQAASAGMRKGIEEQLHTCTAKSIKAGRLNAQALGQ